MDNQRRRSRSTSLSPERFFDLYQRFRRANSRPSNTHGDSRRNRSRSPFLLSRRYNSYSSASDDADSVTGELSCDRYDRFKGDRCAPVAQAEYSESQVDRPLNRSCDDENNHIVAKNRDKRFRFDQSCTDRCTPVVQTGPSGSGSQLMNLSQDLSQPRSVDVDNRESAQPITGSRASPPFTGFSTPDKPTTIHPDLLLPETVRAVIGTNPSFLEPTGFNLHGSVVDRWGIWLQQGISHEDFVALRESYPLPRNLSLLSPPDLNPELIGALNQSQRNKDATQVGFQRQVATALSAVGSALNLIMGNETLAPVLQPVWDVGKALTTLQFDINRTRRRLICDVLDGSVRKATVGIPSTTWLFGDDFRNRVKEVQGLNSTSKGLLPINVRKGPPSSTRPQQAPPTTVPSGNLNYSRPGPQKRGGRAQTAKPRQQQQQQWKSYRYNNNRQFQNSRHHK
uniref:Uncharacterized protein n=1 Tax=Lygus hesperus TaxID=30085 RepID=A0A0A9WR57_LYGHE